MTFSNSELSRIIEMAWEDRTPFEAIFSQFNLSEADTIKLMRSQLKPASFKRWRKRVNARTSKHLQLRNPDITRAYCPTQYKNSNS